MTTHDTTARRHVGVGGILFLALFAAQAGLIAVTPALVDLGRDLGVSTAYAGQLRTITGITAGLTALALSRTASRIGLGRQLLVGSGLMALGSLASAAAPSYWLLAAAQVPVGIAAAILVTTGTLAVSAWVPPSARARVLSLTLTGQPAAWIVGMPVSGLVAAHSWRYAWLVLPFVAAILAGAAVFHRAGEPPAQVAPASLRTAWAHAAVRRWLASELLANTAWAAAIVYAGALFVEAHHASTATSGLLLAVGASAYIAGNRLARSLLSVGARPALVRFTLLLAITSAAFGAVRVSLLVSVSLFSGAAFSAGARTLLSSAYGLAVPEELRPAAMGSRAATMQFGYFGGSGLGGIALALGGYAALGFAMGALLLGAFVLARVPRSHVAPAPEPSSRELLAACAP